MKGIVLETRDGWAAVLREDGVVEKIRRDCQVGQTIQLSDKVVPLPLHRRRWIRGAVAAALALVILSGSYTYTSVSACAYVSLDAGESSVEVAVNRLGRVVSVTPLNEASAPLAEELGGRMRHQKLEPAMDLAVEQLRRDGYLDGGEDDYIIAGVTADDDQRGARLSEAVERSVAAAGGDEILLYTLDVTREERGNAGRHEMSGGRYVFQQRGMEPPRGGDRPGPETAPGTRPESEAETAPEVRTESVPDDAPQAQPETPPAGNAPAPRKPNGTPGGGRQPALREEAVTAAVPAEEGGAQAPVSAPAEAPAPAAPEDTGDIPAPEAPPAPPEAERPAGTEKPPAPLPSVPSLSELTGPLGEGDRPSPRWDMEEDSTCCDGGEVQVEDEGPGRDSF